jgi:hypothetical protein
MSGVHLVPIFGHLLKVPVSDADRGIPDDLEAGPGLGMEL